MEQPERRALRLIEPPRTNEPLRIRGVHEVSASTKAEAAMVAYSMQGGVGMVNSNSPYYFASCGLCQGTDHPTTNCPLSFEEGPMNEEANAVSGNYGANNNPYSNTYNPGWRNHPNFSWRNNQPQLG